MEKVSAVFLFSVPYEDSKGKSQQATVKIEISYCYKEFKIFPAGGGNSFVYTTATYNYKYWRAELLAIDQAIEFAVKELGIE